MDETTIRMNDPVCERTVVPTALQPVTWQMNEDPRSWVVNESFLFPVWGPKELSESWTNHFYFLLSCWLSLCSYNVAREGTAWKWTNHSLRRLVTPESYKRLVHNERNVRKRHITKQHAVPGPHIFQKSSCSSSVFANTLRSVQHSHKNKRV